MKSFITKTSDIMNKMTNIKNDNNIEQSKNVYLKMTINTNGRRGLGYVDLKL